VALVIRLRPDQHCHWHHHDLRRDDANGAGSVTPVSTHKAFALGAFRSSVFFIFAIAAFTERDPHTSTILITLYSSLMWRVGIFAK